MPRTLTVYRWELRKLIAQKRTYLGLGAALIVPLRTSKVVALVKVPVVPVMLPSVRVMPATVSSNAPIASVAPLTLNEVASPRTCAALEVKTPLTR